MAHLFTHREVQLRDEDRQRIVEKFRARDSRIPEGTRVRVFVWGDSDCFSYCLIFPGGDEQQLVAEHIEITRRGLLADVQAQGHA